MSQWGEGVLLTLWGHQSRTPQVRSHLLSTFCTVWFCAAKPTWTEANPTKDFNFSRKFSREQLVRRGGGVINAEGQWFMDHLTPPGRIVRDVYSFVFLNSLAARPMSSCDGEVTVTHPSLHSAPPSVGLILTTVSFTTITKQVSKQAARLCFWGFRCIFTEFKGSLL